MSDLPCWNCGASLSDIPRPISRHSTCSQCHEVLHCCRMCRHYLPDRRPYCDEDRADPPVEKETANFCDFYRPANRFEAATADRASQARDEFASLFDEATDDDAEPDLTPDEEAPHNPDDPRNRLDSLFDD